MRNFQQKKWAGLDCIVTAKPSHTKAVVMLHGYGADFRDLASLAMELDPDESLAWFFPNGILPVAIGPHMEGRAWFPIDMVALEQSMMTGNRRPFADRVPDGLSRASEMIQNLVVEIRKEHPTIILGGFSQGAMVSCDVALHSVEKPAALIQLSGSLVALPAGKRFSAGMQASKSSNPMAKAILFYRSPRPKIWGNFSKNISLPMNSCPFPAAMRFPTT